MSVYIQIEDGEPFIPDEYKSNLGRTGGPSTATKPGDSVGFSWLTSAVAHVAYKWRGQFFDNWYRSAEFAKLADGSDVVIHRGLIDDMVVAPRDPEGAARHADMMAHAKHGRSVVVYTDND